MWGIDQMPVVYAKLVHPENGYKYDVENAKKLEMGESYLVSNISMGQSNTTVKLQDFDGGFNSTQFEFFDTNREPIDIYSMPEFNHYMIGRML